MTWYTCSLCGGSFTSVASDAEQMAAYEAAVPEEARSGQAMPVCEDCFKKMEAAYPLEEWIADRKRAAKPPALLPSDTLTD